MEDYKSLKARLLELDASLLALIAEIKTVSGMADGSLRDWERICLGVSSQVAEDCVRVAVVGPIKSGKSTVVNSFFKGDFLKRGAGVVTSMVTKVRAGDHLAATLFFKTWDEVNEDIARAVVMFPSAHFSTGQAKIDIRAEETRRQLADGLAALPREYLIARDSRNINSVLLANYLEGYEIVRDILSLDVVTKNFTGDQFARHRDFVGYDHLAVYLKDIHITIDSVDMDPGIEIADCQGSDSPNPLHLARIQDYLLLTNLIVYVISSRTGVRQADINFLTMIDRMGIAGNLLFIVNFDFNEHESLDGLEALVRRVKDEVSLILPDPEVHVFSGLYNLLKAQGRDRLSEKEARMIDQWDLEATFVEHSQAGTQNFASALYHMLNKNRYALQLKNHVGRLALVASGLRQWASANLDILTRDEQSAASALERTAQHKRKLEQAGSLLKSTLDGSSRKLEKELRSDIDRFFDARTGEVLPLVINFIKSWNMDLGKYENNLTAADFSNTLYMVFQEFQQALDSFMAETINPQIMGFIKKLEKKIGDHFETIASTYDVMARDAITEFKTAMESMGLSMAPEKQAGIQARDLALIRRQHAIDLPPAGFIMNYTNKIKSEAVMRLGVYSLGQMIRKVLKRSVQETRTGEIRALKHGLARIKTDTERNIVFHFKSYRENIKFQYVFKLAAAVADSFYQEVLDRFHIYDADISHLRDAVTEKRIDKGQLSEILSKTIRTAAEAGDGIRLLAETIASIETQKENKQDKQQEA